MKKKNLKSLALNKTRISELQAGKGGLNNTSGCITASGCSCFSCRPTACGGHSYFICPPLPTEECTFLTCPPPTTGFEIP